ncbi:hypothetical protein U1Q18_032812, partial [Sarracenia purpurea var. burkii]
QQSLRKKKAWARQVRPNSKSYTHTPRKVKRQIEYNESKEHTVKEKRAKVQEVNPDNPSEDTRGD